MKNTSITPNIAASDLQLYVVIGSLGYSRMKEIAFMS